MSHLITCEKCKGEMVNGVCSRCAELEKQNKLADLGATIERLRAALVRERAEADGLATALREILSTKKKCHIRCSNGCRKNDLSCATNNALHKLAALERRRKGE